LSTLFRKIKLHPLIGTLFVLTFVVLLAFRVGAFKDRDPGLSMNVERSDEVQLPAEQEAWMGVFLQGQKIGYVHRQRSRTSTGYRVLESVFLRLNTMGMVEDVRFKTEGILLPDFTLSSFDFDLQSSLFRFRALGIRSGKTLTLFTGSRDLDRRTRISLHQDVYLPVDLFRSLAEGGFKPGESRTLQFFDPATVSQRTAKITLVGHDVIRVMGEERKAVKWAVDFMGVPQYAWTGDDGTVLREEGFLGLTLEQVSREDALRLSPSGEVADLTRLASIPSNRTISRPETLRRLTLRVEGLPPQFGSLNGGRQSFRDGVLVIEKESIPSTADAAGADDDFMKRYLVPTMILQADHPEIQAKAREILSSQDDPATRARKLTEWVYRNIEKRPVLSIPNALETLRLKRGDCNEHAVLLAALARAAGIPAQVEAGVVYQNGRFYYHAWNVLFLGEWVTADATTGQLPADVTHVRLVRGTEEQVDLAGVIGTLKLEITDAQYD
jgi:hypothetical protein